MKTLLKAGFLLALFITVIDAYSQVTIRLNAGLSLCRMSIDPEKDMDLNYGVPVGITAELGKGKYLRFETGLIRSPKGFRSSTFEESTDGTVERKMRFNPVYMEMPVAAKLAWQAGEVLIFARAGLYLGAGSGGTIKTIQYLNGLKTGAATSQISWGPLGTDNLRRFDYGFVLGAGCGIKSVRFELFYEPGLRNAAPDGIEMTSLRNSIFGITAAYTLLSY